MPRDQKRKESEGAFADVKETQLFRRFLGTGHLNYLH